MTPKKRGRPRKTSFYHTRWHRVGLNQQRAAEVLGVSIEDVKRYDEDGCELAERFLLLWDRKHINADGWEGWQFSRGRLMYRGQQWRPENLIYDRHFRESLETESAEIIKRLTPDKLSY